MSGNKKCDLSLMSWNILAPCWVNKELYPTLYDLAADSETRINIIASNISSCNCDVIMIQEAQEDIIPALIDLLSDQYFYEFVPNNPSTHHIDNGLLTLINKDWIYAKEAKIINGILDPVNGEAIQIIKIPSKNIHLVNIHLDYINPLLQAKMVRDKCKELSGNSDLMSIMAGDINAHKDIYDKFQWNEYECVFDEPDQDKLIPSFYPDLYQVDKTESVDHIFYDPKQVVLTDYGKAWDVHDRSLEDALRMFGSDHIYVWANFNFIQK